VQHERRHVERGQARARVVHERGLRLPQHELDRNDDRQRGGHERLETRVVGGVGRRQVGLERGADRRDRVAGVHRLEHAHRAWGVQRAARSPGVGAAEDQAPDAVRAAQRQLLRDHAAERDPEHVRGVPAQHVQQRDGVGGQVRGGELTGHVGALADAAMVVGHDVEVLLEAAQ